MFSIIKVRGSAFDTAMREFLITDKGISLGDTLPEPGYPERFRHREI
jgi:hypothetical protein